MEATLQHVVIAGGTGLVGRRLTETLLARGTRVSLLSRNPEKASLPAGASAVSWDEAPRVLEGADAVINLAGEGIADGRWSKARKALLRTSRTESTGRIVAALAQCGKKPTVLVNASAIGFYGGLDGTPIDETARPGTGVLADICRAWEAAAEPVAGMGVRLVKLRIGIVLAADGGALPKMALPVKLMLGAPLGTGQQGMSWIHLDDLVALIIEAARNDAYEGPVNATAPWPVSNGTFTRRLGKALGRPIFPVPAFITRTALRILVGEMAEEMLLAGSFVYPRKAQALGFTFRFPDLETALADLLPGAAERQGRA